MIRFPRATVACPSALTPQDGRASMSRSPVVARRWALPLRLPHLPPRPRLSSGQVGVPRRRQAPLALRRAGPGPSRGLADTVWNGSQPSCSPRVRLGPKQILARGGAPSPGVCRSLVGAHGVAKGHDAVVRVLDDGPCLLLLPRGMGPLLRPKFLCREQLVRALEPVLLKRVWRQALVRQRRPQAVFLPARKLAVGLRCGEASLTGGQDHYLGRRQFDVDSVFKAFAHALNEGSRWFTYHACWAGLFRASDAACLASSQKQCPMSRVRGAVTRVAFRVCGRCLANAHERVVTRPPAIDARTARRTLPRCSS